jgi:SAM-dependent methyltransferase
MATEKSKEFYDNLRKNEWKDTADFGPSTRTRYRIIKKLLSKFDIPKDASIFDSGCGSGNQLSILLQAGYTDVSGSDFSMEAVKLSQEKGFDNTFQADLTQPEDFKGNTYDVVICSEVLEHIEDDQKAIQTLYNLLNPGGTLIVTVPFLQKHWSVHDEFSGHVRRYEPGEMEKKVKNVFGNAPYSFAWGNAFFYPYYEMLKKNNPSKIMNNEKKGLKKFISKIAYYAFFIDDFFPSKSHGIRLYLVVKK